MSSTTLENQQEDIQSFYEKERKSLDKVLLLERIIRVEESTKSIQREMIISREEAEKRFQLQQKYMEKQFETIDKRFETMDKRFETIDKRMDSFSSTVKWFAGFGLTYITILMTILKYFG